MAEDHTSLQAVSRQLIELSLSGPPGVSFNREVLRIVLDATGALAASLWLVEQGDLALREEVQARSGAGGEVRVPPDQQRSGLRTAYEEVRTVIIDEGPEAFDPLAPARGERRRLAFVPVVGLQGAVGVVRLLFPQLPQAAFRRSVQLAEALVGYYSLYSAQRLLSVHRRQQEDVDRLSKATLQLQHSAFSRELPEVIVNSALEIAGLDRAVLLTWEDGEMRLAAVSSVPEPDRKSAWARLCCELGELVMKGGEPVLHFPGQTELAGIEDEEVRERVNSYCLMTEATSLLVFPLAPEEGNPVGALIMESFQDEPLSPFERALCAVYAAHAGATLANGRLFRRLPLSSLYARRLERAKKGAARGPARLGKVAKWMVGLGVAAVLVWFAAIRPVPEKVKADCFVAPAETRVVTPALAGEVESVEFEHGQLVRRGDLLIKLRTDQLQLSLNRELENAKNITARIVKLRAQAEQEQTEGQRGEQLAEIRVLEHTLAAKQEEIKLLREQLEDCFLKAPIEGSIVEPEHPQKLLGVVVREGEPLCRIGRIADSVTVRIAVPGERASEVEAGMPVEVQLRSLLDREPMRGEVEWVATRSVNYKKANVFMADVALDNPVVQPAGEGPERYLLKPGMTGKAAIVRPEESTYAIIYGKIILRKLKYWFF